MPTPPRRRGRGRGRARRPAPARRAAAAARATATPRTPAGHHPSLSPPRVAPSAGLVPVALRAYTSDGDAATAAAALAVLSEDSSASDFPGGGGGGRSAPEYSAALAETSDDDADSVRGWGKHRTQWLPTATVAAALSPAPPSGSAGLLARAAAGMSTPAAAGSDGGSVRGGSTRRARALRTPSPPSHSAFGRTTPGVAGPGGLRTSPPLTGWSGGSSVRSPLGFVERRHPFHRGRLTPPPSGAVLLPLLTATALPRVSCGPAHPGWSASKLSGGVAGALAWPRPLPGARAGPLAVRHHRRVAAGVEGAVGGGWRLRRVGAAQAQGRAAAARRGWRGRRHRGARPAAATGDPV